MAINSGVPLTGLPGMKDSLTRIVNQQATIENNASCFYSDVENAIELGASLALFSNAYKEDVVFPLLPTDGSGDLTFTRASTATRVNSEGLIEKVRTNVLTYSNDFSNAAWTKFGSLTVTSGQAGYDGTNNAWLLTNPAAGFTGVGQSHSNTGIITGSFYLKAGTLSLATVRLIGTPDVSIVFNLATGTIVSGTGFIQRTITSVGNGWYRCTLSIDSTASSTFIVYPGTISATTAGTIFAQAAQLELGDIATDYIPTTTTAVSVGMTANVPRLDYTGGGCGKLLLEPQRTNLVTYSEQMDNAAWTKSNVTITANSTISPDGTQNADKLIPSNGLVGTIQQIHNITASQSYTMSIFAKAAGINNIKLNSRTSDGINDASITFNLSSGTISIAAASTGGFTAPSGTITNYGNDWYRLTLTHATSLTTATRVRFFSEEVGDGTKGIFLWGGMFEAGSYPTSYIPTLASSVTRLADAASKTGISALIGQTEGTFYCEVDMQNLDKNPQQLLELNQDANNRFGIAAFWDSFASVNRMQLYQFFGGSLEVNIQETITSGVLKVAAAYKANDYVLYINGVQIGTDTSASVPATSTIYLGSNGSTFFVGNGVKQTLLFPTRLTNTQLAELTTL